MPRALPPPSPTNICLFLHSLPSPQRLGCTDRAGLSVLPAYIYYSVCPSCSFVLIRQYGTLLFSFFPFFFFPLIPFLHVVLCTRLNRVALTPETHTRFGGFCQLASVPAFAISVAGISTRHIRDKKNPNCHKLERYKYTISWLDLILHRLFLDSFHHAIADKFSSFLHSFGPVRYDFNYSASDPMNFKLTHWKYSRTSCPGLRFPSHGNQ